VITSTLLGHGFELLVAFDRATLLRLPVLPAGPPSWDAEGHRLHVAEPGGQRYDGNLGPALRRVERALERRGLLVLLVASGVDLERQDRAASVDAAGGAGPNVVGAQIRHLPDRLTQGPDRLTQDRPADPGTGPA